MSAPSAGSAHWRTSWTAGRLSGAPAAISLMSSSTSTDASASSSTSVSDANDLRDISDAPASRQARAPPECVRRPQSQDRGPRTQPRRDAPNPGGGGVRISWGGKAPPTSQWKVAEMRGGSSAWSRRVLGRASPAPRRALDDIEVGVGRVRRLTDRPAPARMRVGPAQTLNRKRFNVIRRAVRLNRLRLHLCRPACGTVARQSGPRRSNAASRTESMPGPARTPPR